MGISVNSEDNNFWDFTRTLLWGMYEHKHFFKAIQLLQVRVRGTLESLT